MNPKMVRTLSSGIALVIVLVAGPAWAGTNAQAPTVGDFLAAYAKTIDLHLPANAGPATIVAALKAAGVKLDDGVDAARALTQGEVVRIGKANGLRLTTRDAEATFSSAQVEQFFASYGSALARQGVDVRLAAADNPPGDPAGHANTNKGSKKGRPFQSPSNPE